MSSDKFKEYEEILRALGYECRNDDSCNKNNFNQNENCRDIPNGFQRMYPQLVVVIGEILGNLAARDLPINVQDAFGNWLQLIGQIILTYNSQQQYFQGGPGRYFNVGYYNVSNPFCENSQGDESGENINRKSKGKDIQREIEQLKKSVIVLQKEIERIKGR